MTSTDNYFTVTNYADVKPWYSKEPGVFWVTTDSTVKMSSVLLQAGLTTVLGGMLYVHFFKGNNAEEASDSAATSTESTDDTEDSEIQSSELADADSASLL